MESCEAPNDGCYLSSNLPRAPWGGDVLAGTFIKTLNGRHRDHGQCRLNFVVINKEYAPFGRKAMDRPHGVVGRCGGVPLAEHIAQANATATIFTQLEDPEALGRSWGHRPLAGVDALFV